MGRSRSVRLLLGVLAMVLVASSCVKGVRAGARCATADWGDDGSHVLRCENGRWVRTATRAQVAELIVAIIRAQQPKPVEATSISVGDGFTCAMADTVRCIGWQESGRLGNGQTSGDSSRAVTVSGLPSIASPGVRTIASGGGHTCMTTSNEVWCWGANGSGQATGTPSGPVAAAQRAQVPPSSRVVAGNSHSCSLTRMGEAYCWGANHQGQHGGQTRSIKEIYADGDVTCVVGSGELMLTPTGWEPQPAFNGACAGRNDAAQATWPASGPQSTFTGPLFGDWSTPALSILDVAFGDRHGCGILSTSIEATVTSVLCWGDNERGQLGDGTRTVGHEGVKVSIPTSDRVVSLSASGATTCATTASNREVWCWGANDRGQMADGTSDDQLAPRLVTTGRAVEVGPSHVCVVGAERDELWCWGTNDHGQLGVDVPLGARVGPTLVVG